jgi:hypothetical protein
MRSRYVRTRILNHGRSGGTYIARVLRAAGLKFGHEQDGRDGASGALLLRPGLKHPPPYTQIFHQVRDPLRVIASSLTCKDENFDLVFRFLRTDGSGRSPLARATLCWLAYTSWADTQASWRYRIEDLPTLWPELCLKLNLPPVPLPGVSVRTNHRPHESVTWEELADADADLAAAARARAQEYGYG